MARRRHWVLAILATVLTAAIGFSAEKGSFSARLSGDDSVPQVKTLAKGEAEFTAEKGGKELAYKLTVSDIEDVTAAHIHQGKTGKSGPPVVGLYGGPKKEGKFSGVLAEGTLTEKDLIGSLKGKPVTALIKLIEAGDVYVNVHTTANPGGELRGQIR